MPKEYFFAALAAACLLAAGLGHAAENGKIDWQLAAECVGRTQLYLPKKIEFALRTPISLYKNDGDALIYPYKFADSTNAPHSRGFFVTGQLDDKTLSSLYKQLRQMYNDIGAKASDDEKVNFGNYNLPLPQDFAWRSQYSIDLYIYRDKRIFEEFFQGNQKAENYSDEFKIQESNLNDFLSKFESRKLFQMPKIKGTCVPYGTIPDRGIPYRDIAITARLIDHREVTIAFQDQLTTNIDARNSNEGAILASLQGEYGGESPKMKILEDETITFDDRTGTGMLVKLYRKNGHEDFLYLFKSYGSNKGPKDKPNLMLRIERDSVDAKGEPVSQKDFTELAHQIVHSIKHMPW